MEGVSESGRRHGGEAAIRDGVRAVTAVVTTSIYCGPGCSARPHPDNVRRFPLAASAEAAGYRACLRCRPYRLQPHVTWASNPELVCRAVRMILAGALDGATEGELGARLGVSGRHLRRLFVRHLGVTPNGLARSARTHFARRLLDDSDLSVLEIATATGFGSVRQLNRACRQLFGTTPGELRKRRRRSDRLVADGGLALRLPSDGTLDWQATVAYLAANPIAGVEHVCGETYRRTIVVEGDPGVLELTRGDIDCLVLTLHLPHWGELIHLVHGARRLAALDIDLRAPGMWDGFETGVRAILERGTGRTAANGLIRRLVNRFGRPVPGVRQLGLSHTFPTAGSIAAADLKEIGLTPAQAHTLGSFARAVADDTIRLDGSSTLNDLLDSITAIDGLEHQTARHLALRLGEPTSVEPKRRTA